MSCTYSSNQLTAFTSDIGTPLLAGPAGGCWGSVGWGEPACTASIAPSGITTKQAAADRHAAIPFGPGGRDQGRAAAADSTGACRDRKSTRLNSSHVKISYAVFCLKKKKNNNTQ